MKLFKRNKRTRLLCTSAALIATAVLWTTAAVAQDHGIGTAKSCPNSSKIGDEASCTITFRNQDEFGDTFHVTQFWDVVNGADRNPAAGNLPIIQVGAGVVCTSVPVDANTAPIGLAFPCDIPGIEQNGGSNLLVRVRSTYTVQAAYPDPVPDQGNVQYQDLCDAQNTTGCSSVLNTAQIPASTNLIQPAISFSKTGPDTAKVGDEITYTVTVTNNSSGDTPALSCTFDDDVAGINDQAITPGVGYNYNYTVQEGDPDPLVNTATVSCTIAGFDNVLQDTDQHSVDLISPAITTSKTGPDTAKVGDEITYTIGFTNSGDGSVENCTGSDTVLGALGAFTAGVTRDFNYTVQAGDPNPLNNTATITCDVVGFDNQVSDDASHSLDIINPSIDVTKTGPDYAKAGDEITYTIGFTTTGTGDLENCTGSDTVLGALGAFTAGVTRDFNYTVQAGDPDPLNNTVTITCDVVGFDNQVSDDASHSVDLLHPAVSVTKECRPDPVAVGQTLTWAITVNNTGDTDLDCSVNDTDAGYVDEPLTVAAGGSESLNADHTVVEGDAPTISNTADISCELAGGELSNVLTDSDSADCEVTLVNEICRTPGFWGTHAGTEKNNSTDLTQLVIDAAGGTLSICGRDITNTDLGDVMSAEEAICVSPKGAQQRQLARQLTAMALNCVVSGGGADCNGTSVDTLFANANAACIANSSDLSGFIGQVDAYNNGYTNGCHDVDLGESDVFDGVAKLPGPAGSSNKCNAATSNDVYVVPVP